VINGECVFNFSDTFRRAWVSPSHLVRLQLAHATAANLKSVFISFINFGLSSICRVEKKFYVPQLDDYENITFSLTV